MSNCYAHSFVREHMTAPGRHIDERGVVRVHSDVRERERGVII